MKPAGLREAVEPTLREYAISICDACIRLEGSECHTPGCGFCWRSVSEVGEFLDVLLIRPVVNGERFDEAFAFSSALAPSEESKKLVEPGSTPGLRTIISYLADSAIHLAFARNDLTWDPDADGSLDDIIADTVDAMVCDDQGCLDDEQAQLPEHNDLAWLKEQLAALAQPDEGAKLATMILQQRTSGNITSLDLLEQARKVLKRTTEAERKQSEEEFKCEGCGARWVLT